MQDLTDAIEIGKEFPLALRNLQVARNSHAFEVAVNGQLQVIESITGLGGDPCAVRKLHLQRFLQFGALNPVSFVEDHFDRIFRDPKFRKHGIYRFDLLHEGRVADVDYVQQ